MYSIYVSIAPLTVQTIMMLNEEFNHSLGDYRALVLRAFTTIYSVFPGRQFTKQNHSFLVARSLSRDTCHKFA